MAEPTKRALLTVILEAVARGWCSSKNAHKVVDPELGEAIAEEVVNALENDTELLTEHSGCGRGPQNDQLTVTLHPGDRVVLLRGPMSAAIAKVNANGPEQRAARVKAAVKPGDLITHTRCLGYIEEHTFMRWEGKGMCGPATSETIRHGGDKYANDIAPSSVTHINRVPVEMLRDGLPGETSNG